MHRSTSARLALAGLPCLGLSLVLATCSDSGSPTEPGPQPSISVALGSSSVAAMQGQSNTVLVTITRSGGFEGPVALSLVGAPAGLTGTFAPASVPAGATTSTLTVAASASLAPGTHNVTVRATGQGVEEKTAALAATVAATPGIALSVDPAELVLHQGTSGEVAVTVTRTNFDGTVELALEGAPDGVTGSFDPAELAAGEATSTLTLTAAADAALGSAELTVHASGDGIDDATAALELTVDPPPAYTLTLNPSSVTVHQGGSEDVAIQLDRTNVTGAVALSVGGAPDGVTTSLDPASTTSDASTLTVDVGSDTEPGDYTLTVTGQADGLDDRTATLELTVTEVGSFSFGVTPASLTVEQGDSETASLEITREGGFEGEVELAITGAPSGMTATVDPSAVTGNSATVTVAAAANLTPNDYVLTIGGSAEVAPGQTHEASVTLTITVVAVEAGCPGPLTNGDNHLCDITVPEELQEWTFTAAAGDYIALSMSRVDGNIQPWIRLFSPTGDLLGNQRGGTVNQINLNAPASGTYTVIVGSSSSGGGTLTGTGDYLLRQVQVPGAFVVPAGDHGGPLTNGDNHPGTITLGDLDMWTFTAAVGDYVALSISRVEGTIEPWIRLISPTGQVLGNQRGGTVNQINLNAPASGAYTVIVGSSSSGGGTLTGTGDYLLRLAQVPGAFVVPAGDHGGPLTDGDNHPGTITLGDLDMWTFSTTQGNAITVTASRVDGTIEPWIRLISPTGQVLGNQRGGSENQISLDALMNGLYTVIVGSSSAGGGTITGTGNYLISVTLTAGRTAQLDHRFDERVRPAEADRRLVMASAAGFPLPAPAVPLGSDHR